VTTTSSFCCGFGSRKCVSGCARARERERDQREGAGYRWLVGIDELLWLFLRALVVELGSLVAWFEEREGDMREVGTGVLKEGSGSPLQHGRSGEVSAVRAVVGAGKRMEVEDDRWAPPIIGGKETGAYPFGCHLGGLWAASRPGPEWLPRSFFPFSIYFLIFFSFSVF
jgi:hypothetical protein